MGCFLVSDNTFLKPGDGALQPKPITNCWVYIQKKYFLITLVENMYQFCFLVIRFDMCHHSADLWLLSKEMVWWASVFRRGPATGRQKAANSLFNFIQVASDGANKFFGNVNGAEMKLCATWEKGAEQFCSVRTAGSPGLTSLDTCHSKGSSHRGVPEGASHSTRGMAQLGSESLPCHSRGFRSSEPSHLLLKALLFTWYLYWAVPSQFNPLTGQWGGGDCLWASGMA